ncbi:BamA/TamA family outer membrane protein [Sphingomonas naphthae]|uniref:BamA/TamA family outer membrane protein n=1 Tax=Sphingomonas naphthae TaxID=1813468 RepID=A0ABY7TJI2_9SPHN|nr:BamA/TamA family outer membrane protein [Sphingomonas naphthae]WCT73110.1 BamA/TamA family outer membrane protein [Sphingomonas naphthae]
MLHRSLILLVGGGLGLVAPAVAQTASDPRKSADTPPQADQKALDDPAFEASLPPLDQTAPPPVAAPEASSVPAADPDLAQPLPPIAGFDATPPPAIAVTDEKAERIKYDVVLKGLKPVDLEAPFRSLSALLQDGRDAANASQVGARASEDVGLAERLMRSEGYYDGLAAADVDTLPNARSRLTVTLTATPGTRYTLGGIAITGAEPEPTRHARDALDLKTGTPIRAAEIESAEANISLRLPERGYPFVEVGKRDILLDERDHHGDYTLPITAGPKSSFGGIRAEGDPVFTADHIEVLTRFDRGQLYDSRQVDDLRQALIATSLLSTVSVEPTRTGQTSADGTETVDLVVKQTKGPQRQLAASAGYGTGEGIKVTAGWTHRNLFPPEGALSVEAIAGTQQQGLSTAFRRSNAGQRDRVFALGASVARQDFDAYNAQTVSLTGSLSRASTPIFQKKWTWSIGGELIATRETRFQSAVQDRTRSTYLIAAVPLQLGYDGSDSLLDPTKGFRVTGRVSPEAQKRTGGGGFDGYARLLAEGSAYYSLTDALVMAGRARVGSIMGAGRDSIAPSRRYYAGGGGSVRGFGFQELGPKDANGDPVGGRSLTEFAVEARYRFGNYGIVPFFDAGRLGQGSTPSISNMRYGAGIGVRYYTNFGPFRIDVATPINRQPGESKIALYMSIGQAF